MKKLSGFIAVGVESYVLTAEEKLLLARRPIAAVVLFTRNIVTPLQLKQLVKEIREIRSDMLIMIDNEGSDEHELYRARSGVWRLIDNEGRPNTAFKPAPPSAYTLSRKYQENPALGLEAIRTAARTIAIQHNPERIISLSTVLCSNASDSMPYPRPEKNHGDTVTTQAELDAVTLIRSKTEGNTQEFDLSKELSTGSSDLSPDIGWVIRGLGRSFGKKPDTIFPQAYAMLTELRKQNAIGVVKHAPDHGWAEDTHITSSKDPRPEEDILQHLDIYRQLASHDIVDMVMMAHVIYPMSKDPHTEASLSAYWLQTTRDHVGDGPLLISDCLSMGAIKHSNAVNKSNMTAGVDTNTQLLIEAAACASNPLMYKSDGKDSSGVSTDLVLICNEKPQTINLLLDNICFSPPVDVLRRLDRLQAWSSITISDPELESIAPGNPVKLQS